MDGSVAASVQPERSFLQCDRIVAFVNDEVSTTAFRTALHDTHLDLRKGNIRHAIRMLETDYELSALIVDISGIDDPIKALEDLARVCPTDVPVALIGDNSDIAFYRAMLRIGAIEYCTNRSAAT